MSSHTQFSGLAAILRQPTNRDTRATLVPFRCTRCKKTSWHSYLALTPWPTCNEAGCADDWDILQALSMDEEASVAPPKKGES